MANGPGKYDKHALRILREEFAGAVLIMVINGRRGHGISCKVTGSSPEQALENHRRFPALLRAVADDMENELGKPDPLYVEHINLNEDKP